MADAAKMKIPEFVEYNTCGLRPTAAVFQLTAEQLKDIIYNVASNQIERIREVTYQFDRKSQQVAWYIWFDQNDKHFVDKTTENTAINTGIARRSKEFDAFASRFGYCEADDSNSPHASTKVNINQILHRNSNRETGGFIALQISISAFLDVIFDSRGQGYHAEYNINTSKCIIRRSWIFEYDNNDKPVSFLGIHVEKSLRSIFENRKKPVVSRAGSF
jgi:hypothetical protein